MKQYICLGFMLMLTSPLYAETYSWIDDSGTYHYTEDFYSVPQNYQKKVKRQADVQQDVKPPAVAESESALKQSGKAEAKSADVSGDNELYGGKSPAVWRKELDDLGAELNSIAKHMEQLNGSFSEKAGISSRDQYMALKKDYDDSQTAYDLKYKQYSELLEKIRKAGIKVDIKK
jgi:hypothetical protein